MSDFLRKLFRHQQASSSQSADEDIDLTQFYTNSEHALNIFEKLISAETLPKRLLVIYGLGGVGKSTLLKMYHLSCRRSRLPCALVASDEALSPIDLLANWSEDLSNDGVTMPAFQKTLAYYRAIQAKVETQAKRSQLTTQVVSDLSKTAAKTTISIVASAIPIVGPLVSAVGSQSAEAFVDWLRSFLTKSDMELYLNPVKQLNNDFLSDLSQIATRRRIILMLDTYEQMTISDDWIRELARHLPKKVLLVIAGRAVPEWDRFWQDWMGKAEIVELREMTPDDIRTLAQRYYTYIHRSQPNSKQIEAIVQFAHGLPMVATTVVKLWVKYRLEDFQSVRPQVMADLVDRLLEGVPQEMRPVFEAAAILRYFNVDALSALLEGNNAESLYTELRHWPFIRSRREGLAVHDTMSEVINEALYARTPDRFQTLHGRAAAYYEGLLEKATGDERDRYALEQLYHRVQVDEVSGVRLFQELAEEFTRYRMVNRLRTLLNDVNAYPLDRESSQLWRDYYNACLAYLEGHLSHAEKIYQTLAENKYVEPKLRAYALSDWGGILCRKENVSQPGGEEKALHILESSLHIGGPTDVKLAMGWVYLIDLNRHKANWEKALFYVEQSRRFYTEQHDYLGLLTVLDHERALYAYQGHLRNLFDVEKEMWNIFASAGEPAYLRNRISPWTERVLGGHYTEAESGYRVALEIARSSHDLEHILSRTRDLAFCLSLQGKCVEALATAEEGLSRARSLGSAGEVDLYLALTISGVVCLKCEKLDKAEEYLAQAMTIGQKIEDTPWDVTPLYLAAVYEALGKFDKAEHFYQFLYDLSHTLGHKYYESGALTGLVRVKHAHNDYAAIPPLWTEAEQLAQQYEYNDYLASLYLTRGHFIWDGSIPEWESGFDAALHSYQHALIHALRLNRFLLDEALSGKKQNMPLWPLIPHCLKRGEEGRRMLIALQDWWQTGTNNIGIPRLDTISPLPEDISLLEAEHLARHQEQGDGSLQKSVTEQINTALTTMLSD